MGRAERRREQRREQKDQKKVQKKDTTEEELLKRLEGLFPEAKKAVAPLAALPPDVTAFSPEKIAEHTGAKLSDLKKWMDAKEAQIFKECIKQAQIRADAFETHCTICNILASVKSLEGFRYGKAAAQHLLDNYSKNAGIMQNGKACEIYDEMHEKWGIELEFDDADANRLMGFDVVDWRDEYMGMHVPESVSTKIWDDSRNMEKIFMQLAVIITLCEGFGFHKHAASNSNKLKKFMAMAEAKYNELIDMDHGGTYGKNLLSEKYGIDIGWSESVQITAERFNL